MRRANAARIVQLTNLKNICQRSKQSALKNVNANAQAHKNAPVKLVCQQPTGAQSEVVYYI